MTEIISAVVAVYFLWPMYVFCMAMERVHNERKVGLFAWILAFPLIVIAIALDIVLNLSVACVVFWEFPEYGEWTISQRLTRLIRGTGWRARVAVWIADNLLDPFDSSGSHIKRG